METESLDQVQARHRRELKDLQGRITNKKKNATKKSRKGINDECADLERQLREKQAAEITAMNSQMQETEGAGESEEGERASQDQENGQIQNGLQNAEEHLESSVAKMKLDSEDTPQPQQHQQQPGKKRNRQKERLARRAAEQEAAAQKAEEEASNMTDHRAKESEYMKQLFATHDLVEKDIEPDGHCLFSAVADQLSQNTIPLGGTDAEKPYKTVRRAAAAYMADNADDFAPFLEEDFAAYVQRIRDTAEWGGQLELTALARRYGVEIRVVQDGRTEKIGEDAEKVLWLAYYRHGYGLGEHYNSLRKKS